MPSVPQLSLTSGVALNHSAEPSCLFLSICIPKSSDIHLGKNGLSPSRFPQFPAQAEEHRRSQNQNGPFSFLVELAGKFRVMREVVAEQEESLTSGGTKILKGWGPLLLGLSL